MFKILSDDRKARAGELKTLHGTIKTPAFMPVATKASVKALSAEDLCKLDAQLLMSNTYHLYLKPGNKLIRAFGGLHKFMSWDGPIMTDSGGFQAFSLGFGMEHGIGKLSSIFPGHKRLEKREFKSKLAKVNDSGITFRSIYDRSFHKLTPKLSMDVQHDLGSDIMLVLDECTSPYADYDYTKESLQRTHRWAEECLSYHNTSQALFGIIQGSMFEDLRIESARFISSLGFSGFSIGGSLGRTKAQMHSILEWVKKELPEKKPVHLLGIGTVEDIFESVKRGIDLFDCVGPTRIARSAYAYLLPQSGGRMENKFRMRLTQLRWAEDKRPIDPNCRCDMCRAYSRAYVHHLFKANEMLAYKIMSYHNLFFMLDLMRKIRESIDKGRFSELYEEWMGKGQE